MEARRRPVRHTTVPRAGRGPPADDEDRKHLAASWRATHRLNTPEVHQLLTYAAAHDISFSAALEQLRRLALPG